MASTKGQGECPDNVTMDSLYIDECGRYGHKEIGSCEKSFPHVLDVHGFLRGDHQRLCSRGRNGIQLRAVKESYGQKHESGAQRDAEHPHRWWRRTSSPPFYEHGQGDHTPGDATDGGWHGHQRHQGQDQPWIDGDEVYLLQDLL